MKRGLVVGAIALVVGLIVLSQTLYVVRVDQFAIVIQFGAPQRVIDEPGLYFKTPFVQVVHFLDKRIQSWDDQAQEVVTLDKKRIYISSFARWIVIDPLRFYTAVHDESAAQMNLDKIIGGNIREVVSTQILDSLVRDTARPLTYVSEESERSQMITEIPEGGGRSNMLNDVFRRGVGELESTFGIGLIDVAIKQLNYTESAQQATIRQMISEREKVAARYEAEGRRDARTIRGETQQLVRTLSGEAERTRLTLEGEARAEAARIRARAYGTDLEFHSFLQRLELLQGSLGSKARFVLDSESPLMELLGRDPAELPPPAATVSQQEIESLISAMESEAVNVNPDAVGENLGDPAEVNPPAPSAPSPNRPDANPPTPPRPLE